MIEWRDVPEWPYRVSSNGQLARSTTRYGNPSHKLITPKKHRDGYVMAALYRVRAGAPEVRRVSINHLMCEAFYGPAPSPGHEAAHYDGVRANNVLTNLRWTTRVENKQDQLRHGTYPCGELNGHKLTREEAEAIRTAYAAIPRTSGGGVQKGAVARVFAKFGIGRSVGHAIVRGHYWAPRRTA